MNCDRCGSGIAWHLRERTILSPWRIHGMLNMCERCIDYSNSIMCYWGEKKPKDVKALMDFFNSGKLIKNKYSAQMNAGYF